MTSKRQLLIWRAALVLAAAAAAFLNCRTREPVRRFESPVACTARDGRLYVLEKAGNTLLRLEDFAPDRPMTATARQAIEPDDESCFYMVRKLYPGPRGIVVQSYIYAHHGGGFLGYRFREYEDLAGPPRDLLTVRPTRPKDYPEFRYACDPRGRHWFIHDFRGARNLWRLAAGAAAVVTNETAPLPPGLEALGETNGPFATWVHLAADSNGCLYASSGDSGTLAVYSPEGARLRDLGHQGFEDGDLLAPDETAWIPAAADGAPRLAVASTGNRSWVLLRPDGRPDEVILPLERGYPFPDVLVGRLFTDPAGRRLAFDLVNKVLVLVGDRCGAVAEYRDHQCWYSAVGMGLAAGLLLLALVLPALRRGLGRLRFPFYLKLLVLFVPLLLVAILVAADWVRDSLKHDLEREYWLRSSNLARAVVNSLSPDDLDAIQTPASRQGPEYERVSHTIGRIVDAEVEETPKWILHKIRDGRYYFGVNVWKGPLFEPYIVPAERAMFFDVLRDKTPRFGRITDEQGEWFSLLTPLTNAAGAVTYVFELYRPTEAMDRADLRVQWRVARIAGYTALAAILLVLVVSYWFTRPLRRLAEEAVWISRGHFDRPIVRRSRDEFGDLARAFNQMAGDLEQYLLDLARTTADKERIQTELRFAQEVQSGILPKVFPPFPGAETVGIAARMEPAREIGGDYFDFFPVDADHLGVAIADVSGKGVPAGLFQMVVRTLLRSCGRHVLSAGAVLEEVNHYLSADNPSLMFVTLFYLVLDLRTGRAVFCNAGHNPPVLLRGGRAGLVGTKPPGKGVALGVDAALHYDDGELVLSASDVLVLYTDGVTECTDAQARFYGEPRLLAALEAGASDPNQALLDRIFADVRRHQGAAEQADDITLLVLRRVGEGREKDDR